MAQIVNPSSLVIALLKSKKDLEDLLHTVKSWRQKGINGTGIVPIAALPLEAKLERSIYDLNEMIKIAIKI